MLPPVGDPARIAPEDAARLSPEMASFRALVLQFVAGYVARWGQSPSYGEIAAKLGSNRTRVKRAVVSLVKAGLLLRVPGPRGLALPQQREAAIEVLRALGWQVDPAASTLHAPSGAVTNPTLLPPAALDYPARRTQAKRGRRTHGNGSGAGAEQAERQGGGAA